MDPSPPPPPLDASPDIDVLVWYNDGETVRRKRLRFLKSEDGLAYFYNPERGIQEILPLTVIVRMEGVRPGD